MPRWLSGVILILATGMLVAPADLEAKLKKVPVDGKTPIIRPGAVENKTIEAKKLKSKKARVAQGKSKKGKSEVLQMDELSDKELARLVEQAQSAKVVVDPPESTEISVERRPAKRDAQKSVAPQAAERMEARVDRLSEADPSQVTVEKQKKEKRGLFGWLRKKKE